MEARRGNAGRARELYAEALTSLQQRLQATTDDGSDLSTLALLHAASGEAPEAKAAMSERVRLAETTRSVATMVQVRQNKAEMLAVLGEVDAAVGELRAVHELGFAFGYRLHLSA